MKKIVLFDIDYTLFDTDIFKKTNLRKHKVYNEVHDVLKRLSQTAELGIFSEGETDFQEAKLKKTDIKKYFRKNYIHIATNKSDQIQNILEKYSSVKLFVVDDKLTILCELKKMLPSVFAIWVKRGIYAENQKEIEGFKPDYEVKDLNDIVSIVNSI